MPTSTLTERRFAVLASLPYFLLLVAVFSVFAESMDDPFITFRYAANALAGNGPVFNVGERVEGFTSTLHLLVCMLLLKIAPSVGMLFKAKLASLAFGLLSVWQTRRLALQCGLSPLQAIFAQLLVVLNVNFALACCNGLETTLYVFLLLSSLLAFLREIQGKGGAASGLLLFLTLLARPETILAFAALLAARLSPSALKTERRSATWLWAAAYLVPTLCFFCLRHGYFGQWLPNTYYAKSAPIKPSLFYGFQYMLQTLCSERLIFRLIRSGISPLTQWTQLIIAPLWWGLILLGFWRNRSRSAGIVPGAILLAIIAFNLRSGGDWMLGWRFMTAAIPIAAIFQVGALLNIRDWLCARLDNGAALRRPVCARLAGALLTLWVVALIIQPRNSWLRAHFAIADEPLFSYAYDNGIAPLHIAMAKYFQTKIPPASEIAYSEMGYGTYVNMDKNFIDIFGLTDGEISHAPSQYKSMYGVGTKDWFLDNHPTGVIVKRRNPDFLVIQEEENPPLVVLGKYQIIKTIYVGRGSLWGEHHSSVYQRIPVSPRVEQAETR